MDALKPIVFAVVTMTMVACGGTDAELPEPGGDARDASISIADGRSDSLGFNVTDAELDAVLDIANTYSYEELDALLDKRAAANIVDARELAPITTLEQLDAIPWVGPAAFGILLEEARVFVGEEPTKEFDISELIEVVEIEGRYTSTYRVVFRGELLEQAREQRSFRTRLLCDDDDTECPLVYTFDEVNDYTADAEPGHIGVSFRSDELSQTRSSSGFRSMARSIINAGNDGPVECKEVAGNPHCVAIYGGSCTAPYRCSVRLPE